MAGALLGLNCTLVSSRNRGVGSPRGRWTRLLPPRDARRIARRSVAIASGLLLFLASAPTARADDVIETQILSSPRGSLLTDPARGLELVSTNDPFLASQPEPDLEVFNATGTSVGTYAPEGAGRMALSADGDLLYVAGVLQSTIRRFDLTQDPFAELSYLALTKMNFPQSLVFAGQALWVADCLPAGRVEKVDPSTGDETVQDLSGLDLADCTQFTDHPTSADIFYAWARDHGTLYRIDVSSGAVTSTASWTAAPGSGILDVALAPGGASLVVAVFGGDGPGAIALNPTTLVETGVRYADRENARAVSVAADGHVAVGYGTTVSVFPAGVLTPNATWSTVLLCQVDFVDERGLDFGPSDGLLFAKNEDRVVFTFSHPLSALATTSMTTSVDPPSSAPGDTVTISGSLTIPGGSAAGRTLELFDRGGFVATTTTDGNGAFGFDVVPATAGQRCYETRFEGTTTATGARATSLLEVAKVASTVSINGPATDPYPGKAIDFAGTLGFDDAGSVEASVIHIARTVDGFNYTAVGDASVDADGMWSFHTTAPGVGDYGYRASFAGTTRYASDQASVPVLVRKRPTKLGITTSKAEPTFGDRITLTATIGLLPGTTKRTIVFRFERPNASPQVVGKVVAGTNGIAKLKVMTTGIGHYVASYAGDARNAPAVDDVQVRTKARIATRMAGHFAVAGRYRLFHMGAVPRYGVAVAPPHRWTVIFVLQRLVAGSWKSRARSAFETNKHGLIVVQINPRILPLGARFRIRPIVEGGATSRYGALASNAGPYTYFRIAR
jgi:hypothetical protein